MHITVQYAPSHSSIYFTKYTLYYYITRKRLLRSDTTKISLKSHDSEFDEFAKNQFQLSAGLNLETLNQPTIFEPCVQFQYKILYKIMFKTEKLFKEEDKTQT